MQNNCKLHQREDAACYWVYASVDITPSSSPSIVADAAHRMLLCTVGSTVFLHYRVPAILHCYTLGPVLCFHTQKLTVVLKSQTCKYQVQCWFCQCLQPAPVYDIGQIERHHIHPKMFVPNDCRMI